MQDPSQQFAQLAQAVIKQCVGNVQESQFQIELTELTRQAGELGLTEAQAKSIFTQVWEQIDAEESNGQQIETVTPAESEQEFPFPQAHSLEQTDEPTEKTVIDYSQPLMLHVDFGIPPEPGSSVAPLFRLSLPPDWECDSSPKFLMILDSRLDPADWKREPLPSRHENHWLVEQSMRFLPRRGIFEPGVYLVDIGVQLLIKNQTPQLFRGRLKIKMKGGVRKPRDIEICVEQGGRAYVEGLELQEWDNLRLRVGENASVNIEESVSQIYAKTIEEGEDKADSCQEEIPLYYVPPDLLTAASRFKSSGGNPPTGSHSNRRGSGSGRNSRSRHRSDQELSLTYLRNSDSWNLRLHGKAVTDTTLQQLDQFSTEIKGYGKQYPDAPPLQRLEQLERLRVLSLINTAITVRTMEMIGCLTELVVLNLSGSAISDSDLLHLESLNQLEELNLSKTGITDAGLEFLRPLRNLKRLVLNQTKITDFGVSHLQSLPLLDRVDLELCPATTTRLTDFQETRPQISPGD